MTPLTFEEALVMVKLVDDWGPLMAQMPTHQRNYMKKAFKIRQPRGEDLDVYYAKIVSEASQL